MKNLTIDDIDEAKRERIFVQDYSPKQKIEGVKMLPVRNFVGEDGDFSELIRLDKGVATSLEGLDDFEVKQINRSRLLSGGIKAWHLHYKQEDAWYLPPSSALFVGLWDLRKDSPTNGISMRISLGGGNSTILYIPRGVAHGMHNVSGEPIDLFYFVSENFNLEAPDEQRLPWDALGADFWDPPKE